MWTELRKLLITTFSMPAAIGLLDKYESQLKLSELVKKIVLNYEKILAALWGWVGRLIPLPVDFDINFYSFFILILSPALFEYVRRRASGGRLTLERPRFWGIASAIAFAGYCIAFSTQGAVLKTVANVAVTLISAALFVALVMAAWLTVDARLKRSRHGKALLRAVRRRNWLDNTLWLAFAVALFLGLNWSVDMGQWAIGPAIHAAFGTEPTGSIFRNVFLLASVVLFAVFLFANLRAPAYTFFWAFGIIAIDYLAFDLLPQLNEAVEEAI